ENVPIGEPLRIEISFVGYDVFKQDFKINPSYEMGGVRKDLGNLLLKISTLEGVVVEGNSDFKLEFDRRVYDVEKNPANAGGTAEDVLRNIPSVQVDMDGNVSMRNAAPQLFVDGRPSTLSIDQIPADAIQRVEIISNPSAKYDASGGGGGIVNIVMKHNRGKGYNGSLRLGGDSRPRFNGGLDLNLREGKFNFFLNANGNQRKSISQGTTDRWSYTDTPNTYLDQTQSSVNLGYFANLKGGVDWFIDNRNTLTISESYTAGKFNPTDSISAQTDTLLLGVLDYPSSTYNRSSATTRMFSNLGTSLLFKHLFAKEGEELSADVNFNKIQSTFIGDYINRYSNGLNSFQRQDGGGSQELITSQVDYTNKISERYKVELGGRGSMRHYESLYNNYRFENNSYVPLAGLLVNYEFLDQVYAGYGTVSRNGEKWKIQLGLRAESSNYLGKLRDTTLTFQVKYPLSLFPSAFVTRSLTEKQDIQLAVSRKINRPSFMQLIPFVDYSDSLNVSRGNPGLRPEFTNLAEFSYQN
ncbi:MAG: outer membrane beta-barrel protein, partial [Flavobacteriales bacterium]